jgi:hypothetical protein
MYEEAAREERAERGLYSRMTIAELERARKEVDQALERRRAQASGDPITTISGTSMTVEPVRPRTIWDGETMWCVDETGELRRAG